MLDEKKLDEAGGRVKGYLSDGTIITKVKPEFAGFFLNHSKNFLNSAKAEYKLSTDPEAGKSLGFPEYNGLTVVVNSSYYSMFHMARALLESEGIRLRTDRSIHAVTFDALVYFFYFTKKLEKRLIESFADAGEESAELAGREKARELMEDLMHEKNKRGIFTYKMGTELVESKAKTSLSRAIQFHDEIRNVIRE